MEIALLPLLVGLIIFVVLFLVIREVIAVMGLDARLARVILLLIGLIFILWLIGQLVGVGPSLTVR